MHARERSALRRLAPLGGGTALRSSERGGASVPHLTSYIVHRNPSLHRPIVSHRFETRAQHHFGSDLPQAHKSARAVPISIGHTPIGACAYAQCLQFFLSRPPSHIHPASFYAISPAESRGSVCGWHGYLPHSLFASVRIGRCPIAIKRFVNCVITIRRSQRGVDTVVLSLHALTCPILSERGFAGDLRYAV